MQAARWSRSPAGVAKLRVGLAARVDRDGAARMEATARRARRSGSASPRAGSRARRDVGDPFVGRRRAAPSCTGAAGRSMTCSRRPLLDDAAEVHDADAIGEARGRREVVRDHQHRQTLVAELVEDAEDLRPGPRRRASRRARRRRAGLARGRGSRRSRRAAAGRRRARAGTDRRRARPARARPARARGRPRPRRSERDPIPWITSGSATVVDTRKRGSSDSYGSW